MNTINARLREQGFPAVLFAPDDAKWFRKHPEAGCLYRLHRDADCEWLTEGPVGVESDDLWVTFVYRNGNYIAGFFPDYGGPCRDHLIEWIALTGAFFVKQHSNQIQDPQ